MDEQFEIYKADYSVSETVNDVYNNPVSKLIMKLFGTLPIGAETIELTIGRVLENHVNEKQKLIIEYINNNWQSISKEQFEDVEFLLNFAKIYEAVLRLTTKDKVEYYMNLLKNGYDGVEKISAEIFDECYRNLNDMSYRELRLMRLFEEVSSDDSNFENSEKTWEKFQEIASKKENISKEEISCLFYGLTRTGFVKQENLVFPDGKNENPFKLTSFYNRFSKYVFAGGSVNRSSE